MTISQGSPSTLRFPETSTPLCWPLHHRTGNQPLSPPTHSPPPLSRSTVFHVSQVKPVATSGLSPPAPTSPPPRTLKGGDLVWEVNRVLAVRHQGRGFHYLMDWVGYGPEDRTWVPRSYLADPTLLEDFYQANPSALGWSPEVSRREGGPVAGAAAGAAATPPSMSVGSGERAGELISSELISNTCCQSAQPTRAHQIQQSGQKRSLPFVW